MSDAGPDALALGSEFPPASHEQWLKLVAGALKGASIADKLVAKTHDSLRVEALAARRKDAKPIACRPLGAPWAVVQRVDHPDPAAANVQALEDIENGATGLALAFAGAVGAYGYGI